jgi:hypothetical protein
MGMEGDYNWDQRNNFKVKTIVPCKRCHAHPCDCKRYHIDNWEFEGIGGFDDRTYTDLEGNPITGILEGFYGYTDDPTDERNCQYVEKGKRK